MHGTGNAGGSGNATVRQRFFQSFSRIMTRPAGRIKEVLEIRGASRVGLRGVRNLTGLGQQIVKSDETLTRPDP